MSENKAIPPQYDLNAKQDACLDLGLRRFAYSSLAGAFGGLLLFRSPVSRWASVAFGAGIGIGSAYTECSHIFDGSSGKPTPRLVHTSVSKLFGMPNSVTFSCYYGCAARQWIAGLEGQD